MNKSEQVNELAAALSKTQAALTRARESATNPFLKNSYADLGDVWDAAREPMTANGLSVAQFPTSASDAIGLTTVLMHASGQWIEDTVYLPLSDERGKSQAQVAGSIISYLRRYGLSAVLGIVTGEDDDGNAGSDPRQPRHKPKPTQDKRGNASPQSQAKRAAKRPAANGVDPAGARTAAETKAALIAAAMDGSAEPASDKQLKYVRSSVSSLVESDADKAKLLLFHIYGVDSSSDLTGGQASALIDWIGATAANKYTPSEAAQLEAHRLLRAFEVEAGQQELAL